MGWHVDASALLLLPSVWWKSTDLGTFRRVRPWTGRSDLLTWSEDTFWIEGESEHVGKHLSGLWRQSSCWPISIVVQNWLSSSWMIVSLCIDLAEKELLPDVTFRSFLEQEITGNKNRKFPDLVPFPLTVSGEVPRSLLVLTGRKIDSDLSELTKEWGVGLNGILKPSRMIERTHLLFVNSPNCSRKWANLPPTGRSGCGKTGSEKDWLSELCGRLV